MLLFEYGITRLKRKMNTRTILFHPSIMENDRNQQKNGVFSCFIRIFSILLQVIASVKFGKEMPEYYKDYCNLYILTNGVYSFSFSLSNTQTSWICNKQAPAFRIMWNSL